MLKINFWNILWTVVNLLILYGVFRKFLYAPVMNVIEAREEMIKNQFADAAKDKEDASKLKSEYEGRLEDAKAEADEIILKARTRAEEEHAKAIEDTRIETEQMREKAKADIASDTEKATKAAQAEIAQLALLAARKIMKTGEMHDAGISE